ncbi:MULTISPECIES: MFS transporter [Clostridium]|uniref:MFS transporter n=1 Tax=Clostridium TaxID=1485 RepID=UPI00189A0395|nr:MULTISPECIES: MFS transporter [Clostridium]MDI9217908.1 MFS transporter [Clostridium tertium]
MTITSIQNDWKKNSILFLTSQTISLFGSMLVQYAITWYITLTTQSGAMMTISIICGFLPSFFISPFAGVWADRYNRKMLIVISDSLIAISTLILAIIFLLGYDAPWMLFLVLAIRSLGTGVQTPAVGSFIPQIVPENKLSKINGINSSIQSLTMLICPMLSGALLSIATIETIFFIDVITAMIAVFTLLIFLKVKAHSKALEAQHNSYFDDMKAGVKYIKNHSYVKKFFLFCTIFFILAAPISFLTPLQVTRSFGNDIWRLTAIEITFSVGMMVGGIIMASWGGFKNRVYTMILSTGIIGLGTFLLGVIPIFWLYLAIMAIVGVAMPIFNTPSTVLLQEKVEPDFQGRVFGVLGMITSIMMPAGMMVFGPLADVIKIEWLLIITGIFLFVQSVFMFKDNVLIEAGERLN